MKHVLVTGGSKGIGLGIVTRLLSDGYLVTTCSRTKSDALRLLENLHADRCRWHAFDLGKDEPERLVADALAASRPHTLWGLVNNAAIAYDGVLATSSMSQIEQTVAVNLIGTIALTRSVVRTLLVTGNAGRIVNITSVVGLRGHAGVTAYSASKAALDGVTRSLARELGRRAITVNSVAPGYVTTAMSASLGVAEQRAIIRRTPAGRLACVDDIAPVVAFLLSDESRFVTGQTIAVDGGLSC